MRRVAAAIGSNAGSTRTAEAWVVRASGVYLGLATKASWPGLGFFEAGGGGDFDVGIAVEGCAQMGGEGGKLHGGIVGRGCQLQVAGCS